MKHDPWVSETALGSARVITWTRLDYAGPRHERMTIDAAYASKFYAAIPAVFSTCSLTSSSFPALEFSIAVILAPVVSLDLSH